MATPTSETYNELQVAYDHYNKELFKDELPSCLITLQRQKRTFGYLSESRFINLEGNMTDEIAMNPSYFATRTIEEVLATLAHEMAHLWQAHFGKPGRGRYHNREWAEKMTAIGLIPSNTGKPGGKQTGDQMTHYIDKGGLFEFSTERLITKDFRISWLDRYPEECEASDPSAVVGAGLVELGVVETTTAVRGTKSTRMKFMCSVCESNAWGKPSLNLICGDCNNQMEVCE